MSISGGRYRYVRSISENPTTISDVTFAEFVSKTNDTILPPTQTSWKNPFRGTRGKEDKLDYAIVYNLRRKRSKSVRTGPVSYTITPEWVTRSETHCGGP